MKDSFAHRLRAARRASGMTQDDMAKALSVSRAAVGQWENGVNEPSVRNMKAINELLDAYLNVPERHESGMEIFEARYFERKSAEVNKNDDVPVVMAIIGKRAEAFVAGRDENDAFDYVPRPSVLNEDRRSFCVLVASDAMSPRFLPNEILYIQTTVPVQEGDYALIYVRSGRQVDDAYLRRVVNIGSDTITVDLLNPSTREHFTKDSVASMERVAPWNELLGSATARR